MKRNVPVQLLALLENMLFDCYSCVKWENISDFFTVMFGVRQGSVLVPFLFAVFLDELSDTCNLDRNRFIVVYADDILLISTSVVNLENLIHLCERELNWLDMAINYKKILLLTYWTMHDVMSRALILLAWVTFCRGPMLLDIWEFLLFSQGHSSAL